MYAIFDRDEHRSYFDALTMAESLNGRLKNDSKRLVRFQAIASVPSFELWLLLHYEDIQHPLHRSEVLRRLHTHIPGYDKSSTRTFHTTRERLPLATQRAQALATQFTMPAPRQSPSPPWVSWCNCSPSCAPAHSGLQTNAQRQAFFNKNRL